MRKYLENINLVGAVMVYRERDKCRWSLDWLCDNCNLVVVLLDNFDLETERIVLEYKNKFPDIVRMIYSKVLVSSKINSVSGYQKRRFKLNQHIIREQVIEELKKIHKKTPVQLLVWLDSDETPINAFPSYLEEFWNNRPEMYMSLGFVEAFDNFDKIISQRMAPHGRVWKFLPEMSALPYTTRTRHNPYKDMRAWKVRNIIVHMCSFNEEYRKQREFCDHMSWEEEAKNRCLWQLPKDVREMSVEEIADYQFGSHGTPSKYSPIPLVEYLKNKKYGQNI